MNRKMLRTWVIIVVVLFLAVSACSRGGDEAPPAAETPAQSPPLATGQLPEPGGGQDEPAPTEAGDEPQPPQEYDSEFPLPDDVQNFTKMGEGRINYQTGMSMQEIMDFYRVALGAQGLAEHPTLTVVNEAEGGFSMAFTGAPNGRAVVIQGVVLSPDLLNVNVRYDDI